MGQILKIAGGLLILARLFGGQVTGAIMDKVQYNFGRIDRSSIKIKLQEGQLVGIMRMTILFKQSFGLNLAAQQLRLSLSQQGKYLGQVVVNEQITLPNAQTVEIPFNIIIPAGAFLNRISELLDGRGQIYAPIDINGSISLNNGVEVPIRSSVKFFTT